jgi:hypothetical protein
MLHSSRFIVGIDLGTTNSACVYYDSYRESAGSVQFSVPQLVAAGELAEQSMLPSFLYLPGSEMPAGSWKLPWDANPPHIVGRFARDQGAAVPGQLVNSAKSWLAHAGVDRYKAILPWGSEVRGKLSPVAVSAAYLDHMRRAWNQRFGKVKDRDGSPCRLEDQQVIITIPASFDETARELTIAAARDAGYGDVTLLEEPLAAFYAWLDRHETDWSDHLEPGERVLVIDVGGGTSDFSFIEMDERRNLHRFAVGEHLLLGGDNIDMAIARRLESQWGTKLHGSQWSMLCQLCRAAKERLLDGVAEETDITLLSKGSSVLESARSAHLCVDEVVSLLHDGFFPLPDRDAPAPPRGGGMRQMGLPYASEPAVTLHLLEFLRYAARVAGDDSGLAFPHKILFNGGSMIPETVRERVIDAIAKWFPDEPRSVELAGDYSMAVATGAAYFGRVRRGDGVKVRGGIAHAYYTEVAAEGDTRQLVCLIARDTDESLRVPVPGHYQLQTNQKVQFPLYSSATRLHDQPGDRLESDEELSLVAPLAAAMQFGKGQHRAIDVELECQLTEIGTLEVALHSRESEHRWPLRFDLRALSDRDAVAEIATVVSAEKVSAARAHIAATFASGQNPRNLVSELEEILEAKRDHWSVLLLRELADELLACRDLARRSAPAEARWLNLAGYCLRPGFGDAADPLRLRTIWKHWFEGPANTKQPQVMAEWWVFWRRIASGLKAGQQGTIAGAASKILMPKSKYRQTIREGNQARMEMWRCVGAMEAIPINEKKRVGKVLLERAGRLEPFELWVLARLGARRLFHASADLALPASEASKWLSSLTSRKASGKSRGMHLFAVARIAALTDDRNLDLAPEALAAARAFLEAYDSPLALREQLSAGHDESEAEVAKILADALPLGLRATQPNN